jgi:hypothetical protein
MRRIGAAQGLAEVKKSGGWGGRIRTFNLLIQSQLRYRCATPQRPAIGAVLGFPAGRLF